MLAPWFGVVAGGQRVTSIERTAYPQFRRLTTARVLHVFFSPTEDEVAWARERTESPESLLALVTDLKCFQKMARSARLHRKQVRDRQGVTYDQRRARAVAEAAIREAALMKNHPPDLINVALERLVEASLELLAFSTLDEMATSIRAEVNAQIFAGIAARIGPDGRQRALGSSTRRARTDGRCSTG